MKNTKGFTLIELLVSIGIMAILTALAAFNFNQARVRSRDVQRKSDLSQIQKALELYKNDNNGYPAGNFTAISTTLTTPTAYTKTRFNDPRGSEWVPYEYVTFSGNTAYYLMACLENTADSTKTLVSTGLCNSFGAPDCKCGPSLPRAGVMYIITNP